MDQKKIELESAKKNNVECMKEDMKKVDTIIDELQKKLNKFGTNTEQQSRFFDGYNNQIREAELKKAKLQSEIDEYNNKKAAVMHILFILVGTRRNERENSNDKRDVGIY